MTENKHFLQPRGVGSVEKHRMSIPPSIATVVFLNRYYTIMTENALPATTRTIMPPNQPHFFFARQHPSSHLLYSRPTESCLAIMPPPLASLLLGAERYTVRQTESRLPVAWSSAGSNANSSPRLMSSSASAARPTRSLLKRKPVKLSDGIDFNLETFHREHEHIGAENSTKRYAKKTRTNYPDADFAVQPTTPRLPDAAPTDTPSKGMPHLESRPIAVVANEINSPVPSQPCLLNCGYAGREIDWKTKGQSKPPPSTEIFHDLSTDTSDKTSDTSPGNCLTSDDWDVIYDTAQDLNGMEAMDQFTLRTQLESQGEFNESIERTRRSTRIVTPHKRRTPSSRREPLLVHTPPGSNPLKCTLLPTLLPTTASRPSSISDVPTEVAPGTASVACPPPKDCPCDPEEICTLIPCCSLWSKASIHICATKENSEAIGKPTSATYYSYRSELCKHGGCTSKPQLGGVRLKLGGKMKACSHVGCTNNARLRGVCHRHGGVAVKKCTHEGCTAGAVKGRVCIRHGAKLKRCSHEGCANQVRKGGVCPRHGAYVVERLCKHDGCTKKPQLGGVCVSHGAKVKACSHAGCTKNALRGGVCWRHGAKVKR